LHKLNILFACDTNTSRPWHRDRLPSIESAISLIKHSCQVIDIYSLLGDFKNPPTEIKYRNFFFQNANIVKLNHTFEEKVMKLNPDVLLLGTADNYRDFLLPKTIASIRSKGVFVAGILGDDEFNFHQYKFFLGWFDLFIAYVKPCVDNYENLGLSKGYHFPNSCYLNSKEFIPNSTNTSYDVILVGSPIANRPKIVKALLDSGVSLAIYGSKEWDKYDYARKSYHGYVSTENFNNVLSKSKIVLALLEDHATGSLHMNTKIWEAVRVSRLPIVTFYEPLINDYGLQEGVEIIMYKNIPDLVSKVVYYVSHDLERIEIAKKLYDKVYSTFNYNYMYEGLFNTLMDSYEKTQLQNFNLHKISIIKSLKRDYKANYYPSSSLLDPCVLDIIKTIKSEHNQVDLVYFNRVESGLQVLQRRPFIGLDSIIFLVPIHNKLHMIYILTKTLLNGRLVHVKQFCVVKEGRTFSGFLNNILDLIIYNDLTYRFKSTMYRHTLIKKIIQKVLKY